MGNPNFKENPTLRDVIHELNRAMSSLNMDGELLPDANESETGWISETLKWGKHSYKHIHCAFEMLLILDEQERAKKEKLL